MIIATRKCGCPSKDEQPKKIGPCPPGCFTQPKQTCPPCCSNQSKQSSKCVSNCSPPPRSEVKCTRAPKFCPMRLRVAKPSCVKFPPCYPPPCAPPPCSLPPCAPPSCALPPCAPPCDPPPCYPPPCKPPPCFPSPCNPPPCYPPPCCPPPCDPPPCCPPPCDPPPCYPPPCPPTPCPPPPCYPPPCPPPPCYPPCDPPPCPPPPCYPPPPCRPKSCFDPPCKPPPCFPPCSPRPCSSPPCSPPPCSEPPCSPPPCYPPCYPPPCDLPVLIQVKQASSPDSSTIKRPCKPPPCKLPPCCRPPCYAPPCPPPPCPPPKPSSSDQCACKPQPCFSEPDKSKKIVSEIVESLPYKEIEAIINNNRMVIRMQKDQTWDLYDPPCDCDTAHNMAGVPMGDQNESEEGSRENNNDVVFEMTDTSKAMPGAQRSMVRNTCDQSGTGGHTVTLYPSFKPEEKLTQPDINHQPVLPRLIKDKKDDKPDPTQQRRPIDFEENPNIFVLRIRKKSGNGDNKQKFDLEFRTPRPWSQKKIKEMAEYPVKCTPSRTKKGKKGAKRDKKGSKKSKKKKKKKK